MSRPVFGDREMIRQLDPFRKVLDEGIEIPPGVMVCRFCKSPVKIFFDDTWINGNEFGAGTIELYCKVDDDWVPMWMMDDHNYQTYDEPMEDESKAVHYIQKIYPAFKNEC